jgi:carbonic anhydrase/acetyltransferase-like protein (isoleucine patch superfamily)
MNKKYEFTGEEQEFEGVILRRIKKISDGLIGGWIEKEENLSQGGECFVYSNARVYGNATVCDNAIVRENARVYGNARVYDNATICDNATVCDNARVYDNARVRENARVYGNAIVYDNATVRGNAIVCDNARVYDNARVRENARVYGNATVRENAIVRDNAIVCGDAIVCQAMKISNGVCKTDLSKNMKESIRCQTGLLVVNNKVIAYKQVRKDLTSFYDKNFKYIIGEYAEVLYPKISNDSCETGLHFSNANYWNDSENILNSTFVMVEIDLDDVITVQEGKIRCKRALVLGKYDIDCE